MTKITKIEKNLFLICFIATILSGFCLTLDDVFHTLAVGLMVLAVLTYLLAVISIELRMRKNNSVCQK